MSKRTTANAPNGSSKDSTVGEPAVDKQKKLLAEDTGHFSMIRMLHLADFITELNGTASRAHPRHNYTNRGH
ncbi:hypothetical protein LSUB1_G001407 [Lachnellula subtilissima]|uniref:Uncharacterized protein n=1 Tax=Lachnellula subtilissima TaxID=602034 RepID=A0A8H8RUY0_9HELO|nr:hypothetical protein LSUB1_G001407 [Lachnellula subtilissima]